VCAPRLERAELSVDEAAVVEVEVTNTGSRPASTVVQLYADDLVASVTRPARELKAYRRVTLDPGEKRTVTLEVPVDHGERSAGNLERVVEPGEFDLLVGLSSRPAALKPVRLTVRG
jgi:beta-glucosidase